MSSVCVTCREVNKHCEHEKIRTGEKWAAPRKNNDKAWKCIASGDIWWNKRRVEKPLRNRSNHTKRHSTAKPEWWDGYLDFIRGKRISSGLVWLNTHSRKRRNNV